MPYRKYLPQNKVRVKFGLINKRGSFGTARVDIEWDDSIFAVGVGTLDNGLDQIHKGTLNSLAAAGRKNLEDNIVRPQEQGKRIGARQTGNFTFGTGASRTGGAGGAFVGTLIQSEKVTRTATIAGSSVQGFGWPDIETADYRTQGAWRSLEWGSGSEAVLGPDPSLRGPKVHMFPENSGFLDTSGQFQSRNPERYPEDILLPGGQRFNKGESNRGKTVNVARRDMGIKPKFFLTDAWEQVTPSIQRDYINLARLVREQFNSG